MAWLDEDYPYRVAISVDGSSGTAGANDVTVDIPVEWDHFWNSIDSSGFGIRCADGDGATAVEYQWNTFTLSTRTATLEINDFLLAISSTTGVVWLYYGIDSGSETNGAGTFTAATPLTGYIELAAPGLRQVTFAPERPDSTVPLAEFSKTTTEQWFMWLDVTDELAKGIQTVGGALNYGEVLCCEYDVETGGSTQASMQDDTLTRVVYTPEGRTWIKVFIDAGSPGTDYTIEVIFNHTYKPVDTGSGSNDVAKSAQRWLLKVRDPDETP